jgi:molybdopterin molybdotransferase
MPEPLPLEEALALVLARVRPLAAERVALDAAVGRVVAEEVRATVDLPPFPSSAMDGYALRSADVPGVLPIVARIAAGRPAERALEPGEAMEISTGGVVPDGADAVVPLEVVICIDNKLHVTEAVAAGAHVRARAGDARAGDVLLEPGAELRASTLGALAAAGVDAVRAAARPRVAVLSTGTELRRPGSPLGPGQVYEANGVMLAAAAAGAGALVERLEPVADDVGAHREALERALAADVVVSTGGVSVGPHDLVRAVERDLGVEEVFWRVAVKPGKPVSFGVRGSTLVFGLPGNPVSALVGFELFVRPALRALQGAEPGPTYLRGRLGTAVRRLAERDQLVRARSRVEEGDTVLEPLSGQESHMIARAAAADALVLVRRGEGELRARSTAEYLPF